VGFYLLYELFHNSRFNTASLGLLVGLTGIPVFLDVVAFAELAPTLVLPFNYEPIGVAMFAVGVLFVVDETFVAVPRMWRKDFVEQFENPIILLTADGHIRDFNQASVNRFPAVADAIGSPLETVEPQLYAGVESPNSTLEYRTENTLRFYTVQTQPLSRGTQSVGQAVIYKDITNIEQQRRELQRQNEQLNDFSLALNHELRNAITVVQGFIDHSAQSLPHETTTFDTDSVTRANTAVTRIEKVIGNLSSLARYGQTPESISECNVRETAVAAWNARETGDMTCSIETDAIIMANHPRLEELFCDALRFAHANEATKVTIDMSGDTLNITDNGTPLSPDVIDDAFEFGPPVPAGDADMSLPNIRLLARVHEWMTDIDMSYQNGVRIRISGITVKS